MSTTQVMVVSLDKDVLALLSVNSNFEVLGFIDASKTASDSQYLNLGTDDEWKSTLQKKYPHSKIILAIDPPHLRHKLAHFYGEEHLASLIAPSATIAQPADIGLGTLIQHGVFISRDVRIGKVCKVNVNAALHHDVRVGNYTTIAPGACLLGAVTVGEQCYVGAGAIVLQNIHIGNHVTIGAGAVVTSDIADGEIVIGVPAKPKKT